MLNAVDGGGHRSAVKLLEHTTNLSPSLPVSATYDGEKRVVVLKFYDPSSQTSHLWYDNTGHKPYCYSKLPLDQLKEMNERPDVVDLRVEEKLDLLADKTITMTKIVTTDPLAIGGSQSEKSIRNLIDCWEADIKYYENYIYDKQLIMGVSYEITDSKITPIERKIPLNVEENLKKWLKNSDPELQPYILEWTSLLSQPLPELKRVSLDIEVYSPDENRIPDARTAEFQILSVALVGSDGAKEVHLLQRSDVSSGERSLPDDVQIIFHEKEKNLISSTFERLLDYPFLISFNGDSFDLNYLYHRAQKLGINSENIPISMGRDIASLRHGTHIDLYKTFVNRSIQIYAFGGKYTDHTLNGICEGLLKESKLTYEGTLNSLSLNELASYNYNDARLTFKLTSFGDDLLMKLLTVISRISKMPIDDVARLGVSQWIRSMMYFEHRRINALIPRSDDLEKKGEATSEAITKGKKYKGGLVVEPKLGVYFNVSVLDFSSLYPSIIKVHNLSYETVRCLHLECRSNRIPGTEHWGCRKRRGVSSLVIGSLRDLRVNYYKPLSKDHSLSDEERNLYNVVSQALKVILNASYGVMGAEIFPLYCLPVAEATAAVGRYAITKTIEKCGQLDIQVVYGDTDSLFLKSPSSDQIKAVTEWAENEIEIELDFEKEYRYVAFSQRKKNYMGVLHDGNVDIKGLTGKKSHTPPFIRQAFYDTVSILSRVLTDSDFEKAREEIKKDLREKVLTLKNRDIPLDQLAFHMMLSKPISGYASKPQHVKAAEQLQKEKNRDIRAGDIISFVKTNTPGGVKPLELASIQEVDNEKYIDYLRGTFDQLLSALGYEFEEILGSTKIEDFFWSSP